MIVYVPSYYKDFHCISSNCKHSCCIGWEIDIDPVTLQKYKKIPSIKKQLDICENGASFHLKENGYCPFLREDHLCDLICTYGESILSQICKDHPRYIYQIGDCEMKGLGLSCEAACSLILKNSKIIEWVPLKKYSWFKSKELSEFLKKRKEVLSILQNRELSFKERLEHWSSEYIEKEVPMSLFVEWLLELETLDLTWKESLLKWDRKLVDFTNPQLDLALEQLMVYMFDRYYYTCEHISFYLYMEMIAKLLNGLSSKNEKPLETFLFYARLYSQEIEYSTENMNFLLTKLDEVYFFKK